MARSAIEIKGLDSLKRGLTDLQLDKFPSAMRNAINYTLADVEAFCADVQISNEYDVAAGINDLGLTLRLPIDGNP